MLAGKLAYVWHAVGHLAAYRVERLEGGIGRDVLAYVFRDAVKLVERLGGL